MRLALTALVAAALLAALPAAARAYEIAGRAWPSGDIRYHVEDSELKTPVRRAARVWNARNLGVRFVSGSAEDAKVFVRLGQEDCGGAARVGYPGRRGRSIVELNRDCGIGIATLTAVHEWGHVLGLGHESARARG